MQPLCTQNYMLLGGMKKLITLGCLAALLIFPSQANASCKVDVVLDNWSRQTKEETVNYVCKSLICGGPQYLMRFEDKSVDDNANQKELLKTISKQNLPLSFDELNGRRVTRSHLRQYTINETYFGALRVLGFQSEGVLEIQVMKNLNLLKASVQCS